MNSLCMDSSVNSIVSVDCLNTGETARRIAGLQSPRESRCAWMRATLPQSVSAMLLRLALFLIPLLAAALTQAW